MNADAAIESPDALFSASQSGRQERRQSGKPQRSDYGKAAADQTRANHHRILLSSGRYGKADERILP
jgi:hypothetical protein